MSGLPTPIVLGLISLVAIALFLFFWRAVRELSLPMKIAARVLLTVVLILPIALVIYTSLTDQLGPMAPSETAAPDIDQEGARDIPPGGAGGNDQKEAAKPKSKPKTANKQRPAPSRPDMFGDQTDNTPTTPAQPNTDDQPDTTADYRARENSGATPPPSPPKTPSSETATPDETSEAEETPAAAEPDWTIVPVYYGTDRKRKEDSDKLTYDWERGRRLELGRALVSIPKVHVVPMVERPWAIRIPYVDVTLYEAAEDPKMHFTIHEMKSLPKDQFLALVREKIAKASRFEDHALIFIHGYKTKFDNAVFRTAQIAYDLKFDSAPFLYSWPSGGTLQGYTYDRESASQAEPYLRDFLDLVVNETGAKKISIIAHSMGNQLLLRVLQDLKRTKPDEVIISQLVLAAPDVDRDTFANIVKSIHGIAEGVTLYTAANDTALSVSRRFNGGVARAGDVPDGGPLVIEGVDTIDATATSMDSVGINHSGYAENNAMLTDIGVLIRTGKRPPDTRVPTLEKVQTDKGLYWRYPQPAP